MDLGKNVRGENLCFDFYWPGAWPSCGKKGEQPIGKSWRAPRAGALTVPIVGATWPILCRWIFNGQFFQTVAFPMVKKFKISLLKWTVRSKINGPRFFLKKKKGPNGQIYDRWPRGMILSLGFEYFSNPTVQIN